MCQELSENLRKYECSRSKNELNKVLVSDECKAVPYLEHLTLSTSTSNKKLILLKKMVLKPDKNRNGLKNDLLYLDIPHELDSYLCQCFDNCTRFPFSYVSKVRKAGWFT